MLRYIVAAAVAAACTTAALAAEEHRRHGAHEHGSAELNVAWEGKTVTIELESPAVNIVGFEHQPRTDAQKKAVSSAMATLKKPDSLFTFTPEARCTGKATGVESELAKAHGHKHDHDKKKDANEHSEFHATYSFTCENPEALKTIDVNVFKLFPKTHKLRAQVVSVRGQSAAELKPGAARLTLP
jgi:hypothetical protein